MVPVTCLIVTLYLLVCFPQQKLEKTGMNYVSGVYFSNWSVYEPKHFPKDVDVSVVSHVFYAFMKIDANSGRVELSDPWADVDMLVGGELGCLGLWRHFKKKNRHLKVVMSVGGWGTEKNFQLAVSSEAKLSAFVESVAELVQQYKFDGVDIDWEYPASAEEGERLGDLLEYLRSTLDSVRPGLLLTVASPGTQEHLQHYNLARMDQVLSFWNVMCYDFAGSGWSSRTGYHLNLYGSTGDSNLSVDAVVAHYTRQGIHPQKIVLGMPLYGRSFYSPDSARVGSQFRKDLPFSPDTVDYKEISPENEVYDHELVAAYKFDPEKQLFISYDNPQCAIEKSEYVKARHLRGGFWWDSKGESKAEHRKLINAFVRQLGDAPEIDHSPNWI